MIPQWSSVHFPPWNQAVRITEKGIAYLQTRLVLYLSFCLINSSFSCALFHFYDYSFIILAEVGKKLGNDVDTLHPSNYYAPSSVGEELTSRGKKIHTIFLDRDLPRKSVKDEVVKVKVNSEF